MTTSWQINVFGVRHLSPTGAWHLRRYLDQVRAELVLIEGLADANELIPDMTRKATKPPIAILAYTDSLPVRTLVYPLARYSPEFQALKWADEQDVPVEFIDLPSDIFLALQDIEEELIHKQRDKSADTPEEREPEGAGAPPPPEPELSIHDQYAQRAGEADYETYWERHFEHNLSDDAYRLAAFEFGQSLRDLERDSLGWRAENLVREAYMRRRIEAAIAAGHKPKKIVAVVGAFHASVLNGDSPAMSDEELASLRRRASKLTLMPYSYFKLSSQSGCGAGNHAPAYFELLWESLEGGELSELPSKYLPLVVRHLRESGTHRSTAEIIEGVRLAKTLSALKDGLAPTLADLRDSAVTLVGHGETLELAVGYKFKTTLETCTSIAEAADLVRDACQCGLMKSMEAARKRLQELSAGTSDLTAIAHAAYALGQIVRYGDVRKFDPSPLLPLVEELFVQGSLALHSAAVCDNEAAVKMLIAIDEMNRVALEYSDRVDEALWIEKLHGLSDAGDRNPLVSGYACAVLIERGLITNEVLIREVSRRLSPGIPADLGAGWFEGLSKRNRYALLARQPLWVQLADDVSSLDEDHFRRALVFLRRAFGSFSPREKRQIAENLGEHWGVSADAASEVIEKELSAEEEKTVSDLNDFSFDEF